MKSKLYLSIILLFFISCNREAKKEVSVLPTEQDINEVIKSIVFNKEFDFMSENLRAPICVELRSRKIVDKREKFKEYDDSPFHRIEILDKADLIRNKSLPVKDFFKKEDWQFIKRQYKKGVQKLSPKMFGNLKLTTIKKKHENWFFYFSVPIFSSDLKRAYIQYSGVYFDFTNDGTELFLEKRNDKWEIVGHTFWSH